MEAGLLHRSWLRRTIVVYLDGARFEVTYSGLGLWWDSVLVDGVEVMRTSTLWFVPRFEFFLDDQPVVLEVRVWPWMQLRRLTLTIAGRIVYWEGTAPR